MFRGSRGKRLVAGRLRAAAGLVRRGMGPAAFFLLMLAPAAALGEPPLEALKRHVDEGLRLLNHERPEDAAGRLAQRARLEAELRRLFDFREFSRRVLGGHWQRFTPAERDEFVEVFSRFLAEYYLLRVQQHYTDERVVYVRQEVTAPGRALVELKVIWKDRPIPVEVRMAHRGGWKVYDVAVVGISAVQIYRAQLQEILSAKSPAETIALIRRRLAEAE